MTELFPVIATYLLAIILSLVVISLSVSLVTTLSNGEAPFVRSKKKTVDLLVQIIELSPQSRVYELGSGDGRILNSLHSKEPRAEYWGVEKNYWPALLFWIRKNIEKRDTVNLKKSDLFDVDLTKATHVIIYLLTKETARLLPKLEKELPVNSVVYSIDFPFPEEQKEPESVHRSPAGQTIYVYRF